MNKSELLIKELKKLYPASGIIGCAVIARNGSVIASHFTEHIDEIRLGAMVATLSASAELLARTVGKGYMNLVNVKMETAEIIVISAGAKAVISVIISLEADVNSILKNLEEISKVAKDIIGR